MLPSYVFRSKLKIRMKKRKLEARNNAQATPIPDKDFEDFEKFPLFVCFFPFFYICLSKCFEPVSSPTFKIDAMCVTLNKNTRDITFKCL